MALLDRVRGILLEPRTEWPKIAAEPATTQSLYTGWIMIFAAIGPLALLASTTGALTTPRTPDERKAALLGWIGGIFNILGLLGGVLALIAAIYSWYTFYLGAPVLKKCAPEKAVPFTIVVVLCGIALGLLFGFALSGLGFIPRMTGFAMPH